MYAPLARLLWTYLFASDVSHSALIWNAPIIDGSPSNTPFLVVVLG